MARSVSALDGPEWRLLARQAALTRVVSQYAVVCCNGNTELAALELRRQLRDHVVFERCAPHSVHHVM